LAVKPARYLVLTKEQHILLGELVEIMGQIDHMRLTLLSASIHLWQNELGV